LTAPNFRWRTSSKNGEQLVSRDDGLLGCVYRVGFAITWILVFLGCWIYCIDTYGFLFGVGLGWLPSGIVATIAAVLWPLLVLGGFWLYKEFSK
jgi:hypothetical protein